MGLPQDWDRVEGWLHYDKIPEFKETVDIPVWKTKNPEIPVLPAYNVDPGEKFWKLFPSHILPKSAETKVDGMILLRLLNSNRDKLTKAQYQRGLRAVSYVAEGATCAQKTELPSCMQKNAKNAMIYGEAVTDTVASWVKEGFAAGPFDSPPLDKFRVNCLMAIPQNSKVRPVLNGSLPLGNSLNSNVDPVKVEKVKMCSARCFSYSVIDAGKSAVLAKMDMVNAYKNVPCAPSDLRLQGFCWLNKYFVETRQIFGAKTAVCNYDVLANTLLELALIECKIHRGLVHRQLDDVPIVVPSHKENWCSEFVNAYKKCCNAVGIELACDDPNYDKAFSYTKIGKVLGIIFSTEDLRWKYPDDKKSKTIHEISKFMSGKSVNLLQMQQLMGRLNDVCLMAPFLKVFKSSLNEMLGILQREGGECYPSSQCLKDILVWAGFLLDKCEWNNIAHCPSGPPLSFYDFTSDAAGMDVKRKCKSKVGFGLIGFDPDGIIILAHQYFWPIDLYGKLDGKGACFGSKTLLLEAIGLLSPLLLIPNVIQSSYVVLNVDNIGCYYGWENKCVQGDKCATVIFRAIALICAYLEINLQVRHLPRLSSWEANLCDRLSREDTTSLNDKKLLKNYESLSLPKVLKDWLKDPNESYDLCYNLLNYVKSIVPKYV